MSPVSFQNVKAKWIPEISHYSPKPTFLLVGTKVDLRNNMEEVEKLAKSKLSPVTTAMGMKLAKEIKAFKYVECSALTKEGLKVVFDTAIRAALHPPKQAKCSII